MANKNISIFQTRNSMSMMMPMPDEKRWARLSRFTLTWPKRKLKDSRNSLI